MLLGEKPPDAELIMNNEHKCSLFRYTWDFLVWNYCFKPRFSSQVCVLINTVGITKSKFIWRLKPWYVAQYVNTVVHCALCICAVSALRNVSSVLVLYLHCRDRYIPEQYPAIHGAELVACVCTWSKTEQWRSLITDIHFVHAITLIVHLLRIHLT